MNKTVVTMATFLLTLVLWVPIAMSDRIGLNPDEPGYDPGFQFFNPFNWYDEVPAITVRDTIDKTLFSSTGIKTITIKDLHKYYTHVCPGITQGMRLCMSAARRLFDDGILVRGDIRVVTGSDHGPVAAIEYLTGAHLGVKGRPHGNWFNGKLIYDPGIGKKSFIFQRISTGKAISLTSKIGIPPADMTILHHKAETGKIKLGEKEQLWELARKWAFKVMIMSEQDLFEIEKLTAFDWNDYANKE